MLMLELLRALKARRAVVGKLRPLMRHIRTKSLISEEEVRYDAFLLGFLGTLITRLLDREAPEVLGADSMGLGQAGILARLTGLPAALLGPELCELSTAADARFLNGCGQADRLLAVAAEMDEATMLSILCEALDDAMSDQDGFYQSLKLLTDQDPGGPTDDCGPAVAGAAPDKSEPPRGDMIDHAP